MNDHTLSKKQISLIIDHLFTKPAQKLLVEAVVTGQVKSVYEAEKRFGIAPNTGTRYTKKYEDHIKYLEKTLLLDSQALLWETYMSLDHGEYEQRLLALNKLEKHFDNLSD